MHPVPQRSTLVQQVAEILRNGIRGGLWRENLPAELELSEKFQVSRMTLRAALKILTREGWLSCSQGRRRRVLRKADRSGRARQRRRIVLLTDVPLVRMPNLHMLLVDGLREEPAQLP